MKNRKFFLIGLIFLFIVTIGVSYSYFESSVVDVNVDDIVTSTSTLHLTYSDSLNLTLNSALPGDSISKTFSVVNDGTIDTSYSINIIDLINTIDFNEIKIVLECTRYLNGTTNINGTCSSYEKIIPYTEVSSLKTIIRSIDIETGYTHKYNAIISFVETNNNQNYNQGKSFRGKINIEKSIDKPVNECTFSGSLVQGAEYVNGQYTYRYMQEGKIGNWQNITADGWGVKLTNPDSTDPVTTDLCTSINNKPIVSMSYMFYDSKASSIDLSSFDTSDVTNMVSMFGNTSTNNLDLSYFDTSNVTNMEAMFYNNKANNIDLSTFDTSQVTNMSTMFYGVSTPIDVTSFNTSNVTDMSYMFARATITSVDLSNFDTSKVTNMNQMFAVTNMTVLDLSSFDTHNVTSMEGMFYQGKFVTIYATDNFNVSNVTNGNIMFFGCTDIVGGRGTNYYTYGYTDERMADLDIIGRVGFFTLKTE